MGVLCAGVAGNENHRVHPRVQRRRSYQSFEIRDPSQFVITGWGLPPGGGLASPIYREHSYWWCKEGIEPLAIGGGFTAR